MTRRFPPWRIRATTCLCPTFTTFTPFTWDRQAGGRGGPGVSSAGSGVSAPPGRTGKDEPHLDEEVPCAQPSPPGHALHVHGLKVLQRGEGWRGGELLDGGLCCRGRGVRHSGRCFVSVSRCRQLPHSNHQRRVQHAKRTAGRVAWGRGCPGQEEPARESRTHPSETPEGPHANRDPGRPEGEDTGPHRETFKSDPTVTAEGRGVGLEGRGRGWKERGRAEQGVGLA